MQIWPILLAGGAVRVGAETASVLADIDGLYPHVDGCGDNIVPKAGDLFWEGKDFEVAVLILLHHSSFRSTSMVEVPTLNLSNAL